MAWLSIIAGVALALWAGLLVARGGFWRMAERLPAADGSISIWPAVTAVVPARDEAEVIGEAVRTLVAQDYPGDFHVVVVDDNSGDGTAAAARAAAVAAGAGERLTVLRGAPLAAGWAGKVWAMEQGLRHVRALRPQSAYVLFTDADIAHPAWSVSRLVGLAGRERRDMVSLMVRLATETPSERLLIPAFVLFFQKLYPFRFVNDPERRVAAAAGGCILVRRRVLDDAHAMASIHDRLIDDCALAEVVKRAGSGRIWLGLGEEHRSLRGYGGLAGVWKMVARSAFTQLRHSAALLAATLLAMLLLYVAGPAAALTGLLTGTPLPFVLGAVTWALMAKAFQPVLRLYRQPLMLAPLLPLAGILYTMMTADSARRDWQRRGGGWKGRFQAKGQGA